MYFLVLMQCFHFSLKFMIQDGFLEIFVMAKNLVTYFYFLKCLCLLFNISVHIHYGILLEFFVENCIHIVSTYHLKMSFLFQNLADRLLLIVNQCVNLNVYLYYYIDYYVFITFTRLSYFFNF